MGLLCSPPFVPVYLCVNVGPQGLLVVRLPASFVPHSASLGPAMATRVLSTPAAHLRPSYPVSYTHLTLPTKTHQCRSRWSPYH